MIQFHYISSTIHLSISIKQPSSSRNGVNIISYSKEFSDTELKSFKYKGSVLPYSLGDIYDIQPDKEQGNRWLIGHGNFLSYTDINFEKKELQGLNKMVRVIASNSKK